jgi:cystathionine beta-lyase/cystathionine gamma-synthase
MSETPLPRPSSLLGETEPLVPPLFQSSVYSIPDLDALDRIMNEGAPGFIYARDAHPNARLLAHALARLEAAPWGVICGSGMAAISALVLAHAENGQRIVAGNRLYGRTVQLFEQQLSRYGIRTDFVDANDLDAVEQSLRQGASLLFVETMSNPLLRVVDVRALAELARQYGVKLAVDNTFATPVLLRPLELGADLVMESLTKVISGHSDVTLGLVCGRDRDLLPRMNAIVSIWGLASTPFDCWLAERGLHTLELRMKAASRNAALLAPWLLEQPGVRRVHYPGLPDHPDHALAREMLGGWFGNMLCFELEGGRDAVNHFLRHAPGIPFSPSLGHAGTTLSHPATTSHRYAPDAEKKRQGITDGLIRLSVGIEEVAAIQAEISKGLES